MPRAIDTEALESPNMQIMDLGNPPTKSIPYHPYPKMVYLHPKDKTKTHKTHVVHNAEELEVAEKQGYKTNQHIPTPVPEDLSGFEITEMETAPDKRGPGRPKAE